MRWIVLLSFSFVSILNLNKVSCFRTDRVCGFHGLWAAWWFADPSGIFCPDPELVLHVLLQASDHKGEPRDEARCDTLITVTILLYLLHNVALDGTAAIVVWSLPAHGDGLGGGVIGLYLDGRIWFLCRNQTNRMLMYGVKECKCLIPMYFVQFQENSSNSGLNDVNIFMFLETYKRDSVLNVIVSHVGSE